MNQEQMERLARYATDKYIDNLTEEDRKYLMMSKEIFIKNYISTFNIALLEVQKSQNNKFQKLGVEQSSKTYK